jgi:hypothetical protein
MPSELRDRLLVSVRERPLVTGVNGPLMIRLPSSDLRPGSFGLTSMMPGTILIPPSAVALASHDPGVSDGYGQAMVALRKHQQVGLPTIRR